MSEERMTLGGGKYTVINQLSRTYESARKAATELAKQAHKAEKERDALAAKLAELEGQTPFDASDERFREAFEATIKHGNWPDARKGDWYRSPMTQMAWDISFATVNHLKLYARPIPAEQINARLLEFAQEWLARQGTDENYMTAKARAAIAAAEARGVTGPKRLTDEEIMGLLASIDENSPKDPSFFMIDPLTFARAIEAAVLGVQEGRAGIEMTNVEKLMEQAQVFASAWSLVGSPIDTGDYLEQAEEEKDALRKMAESMALEQRAFGIIDPDYARIYTQARIIAWMYGYSCCAQGSFTRDLDLLLVPWTETAKQNVGQIVAHLASVCDLSIQGEPSEKPNGRKAWTLKLPGFGECRWVDLSAFAPAQQARSES